jgi:hypothetical protein
VLVRPRTRAVALSVSLVIAASGGATASAASQPPAAGSNASLTLVQAPGPALADEDGTPDDDQPGADRDG